MPTYEFKCTKCDAMGTAQLKIEEDKVMRCPRCLVFMDRVYSAPGLVFKGGGWGGQ
jgi:putative FmdB family regulatory protein